MCEQSNCTNYHPKTTNIQLIHTGLTLFLNIGSKMSKSNMEKFGGTLSRSSATAHRLRNTVLIIFEGNTF
jgi:hypothetical protein